MSKIAIIPARAGSRRLPGKNILQVMGRPALYYPVREAIASSLFDQVIVSTEDSRVKAAALDSGARVMDRPSMLAKDDVGVVSVCESVLKNLEAENCLPDVFCCIYATAVFIGAQDLAGAFGVLASDPSAGMVMGVSSYNFPPVQALESRDGYLEYKWPEYKGIRTQQQPRLLVSNGTFYWAKTPAFLKEKTFYASRLKGYEIPWLRAIDMDTPGDYENVLRLAPLFLGKG